MPIDRSALTAVMRLAAPDTPLFQLDAAVDAAIVQLAAVTTADGLAPPAPARAASPEPAAGQVRVEVIEASEREWPDSGLVLSLTLRPVDDPDGQEIRVRFDAARAVPRRIALEALGGLGDDDPVSALVGRQAVVEPRRYVGRDGNERVGVAKWIVPRKPRQSRPPVAKPRKPDAEGDDAIPF